MVKSFQPFVTKDAELNFELLELRHTGDARFKPMSPSTPVREL
jgi:hypothetical protein